MPIRFYKVRGQQYGPFANFSNHGFELDGRHWKTSEHYYQANKFDPNSDQYNQAHAAGWAGKAAELGRTLPGLVPHWDEMKDDVMRCALYAKFTQNPELKTLLLSTGKEELIEASPVDYYWGEGKWGNGKNMLGKLLMELRTQLRLEDAKTMNVDNMIQVLETHGACIKRDGYGTYSVGWDDTPEETDGYTDDDIKRMYCAQVVGIPAPYGTPVPF